jgi:GDPmannose 4,6-dehydratase
VTKVLVTGASGQDAYYLMPKLAALGYEVYGVVRGGDPGRLMYLKDIPFLRLVQGDLLDYPSLLALATEIYPDIVINTAGLTSPADCWGTPELAQMTNGTGAARLLDIISNPEVRYIQFGSIAEFGPYGASKLYAERMMDDYRIRGFRTTTIKFVGHHSPRRRPQFFSRRVSMNVAKIKKGLADDLTLGPLDRLQDWGWAPEFMDGVIEILDKDPGTYWMATGKPASLEQFVEFAFRSVDLEYQDYVKSSDDNAVQPFDVPILSSQADDRLQWRATTEAWDVARMMVEADLALLS